MKPEAVDYQFYKPSSDCFEDNFFGEFVEVTASYNKETDMFCVCVFGTNVFGLYLETADIEVQDEALFNIMKQSRLSIKFLESLGFTEEY